MWAVGVEGKAGVSALCIRPLPARNERAGIGMEKQGEEETLTTKLNHNPQTTHTQTTGLFFFPTALRAPSNHSVIDSKL